MCRKAIETIFESLTYNLKLNSDKCKAKLFAGRKECRRFKENNLKFNSKTNECEVVASVMYVGVIINSTLKVIEHVEYILKNV